jgi:hypothetical protein
MPDIEVVQSPRPEDGHEPPLPTYHELLSTLCDEFHVPGSQTFSEAIRYIKGHRTTEMFEDWFKGQYSEPSSHHLELVTRHSVTPEGRERIAASYIEPARQHAQRLMATPGASTRAIRVVTNRIENLIQCFPEEERFCEPLITLREVLIEIYGYMSPNYEAIPDQEPQYEDDPQPAVLSLGVSRALREAGINVQAVFTSENGIVIEVPSSVQVSVVEGDTYRDVMFGSDSGEPVPIVREEPPYEGPRPTLFERLFKEED